MSQTGTPKLILYTDEGVKPLQLNQHSTWTIGRSRINTIPLADRCASRHHAKLEVAQDNRYYLVDLNSRNGSLVNDQPVKAPVLLKHGNRIKIGQTEMVFQHELFKAAPPASPAQNSTLASAEEVLMLQASATQGKIWQDLLRSHDIGVHWAMPGTDLNQYIARKAAAHILPQLLMLDIQAFREDPFLFCHKLQQQYPQVKIILMNSELTKVAGADYQRAIAQGCVCLLPALRTPNLLDHAASIVAQINVILQALGGRVLRQDKLFLSLQALETVLKQRSPQDPLEQRQEPTAPPKYPATPDPWDEEDSQELTSIQVGNPFQISG